MQFCGMYFAHRLSSFLGSQTQGLSTSHGRHGVLELNLDTVNPEYFVHMLVSYISYVAASVRK